MSTHITSEHLSEYSKNFRSDRASRVASDAVTSGGLLNSCKNPSVIGAMNHEFSLTLEQGDITNQNKAAAAGCLLPPM